MSNTPDVIYHYCSADSFVKIIKSKSIWLSRAMYLNDYAEIIWIEPIIEAVVQTRKNESNEEQIRKLLDLYKLNNFLPFLAAFSEHDDALSQWRAYADDGRGVAIGFNPQYFDFGPIPVPGIWPSVSLEHTIGLRKVIYKKKDQFDLVNRLISNYLEAVGEEGADEGNLLINAAFTLRNFSWIFKNPAFNEEAEWRIIHVPLIRSGTTENENVIIIGGISDLKFRSTPGRLIPYLELSFSEHKATLPIVHVVLGPKNEFPLPNIDVDAQDQIPMIMEEADYVDMFLRLNGLPGVEISKSAATYR